MLHGCDLRTRVQLTMVICMAGNYLWGRIGCGDVQQRDAASCIQHKDKEHGRCFQQILGWHLPAIHLCDKTRESACLAEEVECR